KKLAHERHAFLLEMENGAVNEGRELAAISQKPGLTIPFFPLAWVRLAAKVRIPFQHMTTVDDRFSHHVGPCPHWPGIQREPMLAHARLRVEAIRLPGNRRGEGHGQPVTELWVFAQHPNAQRVIVDRLHALESVFTQVQPWT